MLKVTRWRNDEAFRPKGGLSKNATRRCSHENRNTIGNLISQSPVILMGVTDDHANEGRVVVPKSSNVWKWDGLSSFHVQRPADVEHKAMTTRLDLYTTAPNLVGTTVNANSHLAGSPHGPKNGVGSGVRIRQHAVLFPSRV